MTLPADSLLDPHALDAFVAGLAFGAVNSLHCVGMCGPMASLWLGARGAAWGYHTARTVAYTAVGLAAGALGSAAGSDQWSHGGAWISVVFGAALLLFALGLDKHLGAIPGAGALVKRSVGATAKLGPTWRATAVGALTPLLPCGLLWAAVSAGVVAGGATAGALSMLGFALGLLPLLAFAQFNLGWLQRRFGHDRLRWIARGLMVVAAGMLLWRGVHALRASTDEPACPLCSSETADPRADAETR